MTKNLIVPLTDGLDTVPQESTGQIFGKILKFREGEFILDKQSITNGAQFVVRRQRSLGPMAGRLAAGASHHPTRTTASRSSAIKLLVFTPRCYPPSGARKRS